MSHNRAITRKLFAIPKDPRAVGFFLGSLWILEDLDSSCVLKLSLLRSEYSDLLSDSQTSPPKPLLAKVGPEWSPVTNKFAIPKDLRL